MMLALSVSMRILPVLDRHMREDDCAPALLPGASDLVAHSEHEGGVGGWYIGPTVPQYITPAARTMGGTMHCKCTLCTAGQLSSNLYDRVI